MKKAILLFITIFTFLSCEVNDTFKIEFTNGSNNTYKLYINDVYQTDIAGKSKATYNIPSGYWSAEVVQKDGYILYPTTKKYTGTCLAGESYYIVFP